MGKHSEPIKAWPDLLFIPSIYNSEDSEDTEQENNNCRYQKARPWLQLAAPIGSSAPSERAAIGWEETHL